MHSITISGHSDDLIEVDGDIREEFGYNEHGDNVLACSDGSLISVHYDGAWNINVKVKGTATVTKAPHEGADSRNYTDILLMESETPIKWVALVESVGYYGEFLARPA